MPWNVSAVLISRWHLSNRWIDGSHPEVFFYVQYLAGGECHNKLLFYFSLITKWAQFFTVFPWPNKGLDFRVKCQCQDMVPPAVHVLAFTKWLSGPRLRCQALTISKATNNNKQAEELTCDFYTTKKDFRHVSPLPYSHNSSVVCSSHPCGIKGPDQTHYSF